MGDKAEDDGGAVDPDESDYDLRDATQYFDARVERESNCVLVVVGSTFNGEKELPAITNGVRESEASWKELLLDLKGRGMTEDPKLAIADGA